MLIRVLPSTKMYLFYTVVESRGSSVSIVIRVWVLLATGSEISSPRHLVQTGSEAQWVPGTISIEVTRPGREASPSPQSSAEVRNTWSYTSIPQHVFMV